MLNMIQFGECLSTFAPARLKTESGDRLILPIDEGISIPCDSDDEVLSELSLLNFKRSFCCREGTLSLILWQRGDAFTALAVDDITVGSYSLLRENRLLTVEINVSEHDKALLHIFSGSLSKVIQSYRELRRSQGWLVTLEQKSKRLPSVMRLARSADLWIWQDDFEKLMYSNRDENVIINGTPEMTRILNEMKAAGMDDILMSLFFKTDEKVLPEVKRLGYMSTKYDNYNDVPPDELLDFLPRERVEQCDYLKRRIGDYPDKIIMRSDGKLGTAWQLDGTDGKRHSQYTMCPVCALEAMKNEIPAETQDKGYSARFIDVFGGSLSECHSPGHSFTRWESVKIKNAAFELLTDLGLMPGTEDGMEAIIPSLVYNEGMASPVFMRLNWRECGRLKARMYEAPEETEWFRKYMLNPVWRFPMWELVARDCVISFPYWGDSTLCCPDVLQERILLSALFGTPPLYSIYSGSWERLKDMILSSYQKLHPLLESIAGMAMTDYSIIAEGIYHSEFGNRFQVIANFRELPYYYNGFMINAKDFIFHKI